MTKVLLLYEVMNASTRLCAYEQLKYLHQQGQLELVASDIEKVSRTACERADVIIFMRSSSVFGAELVKKLKNSGKYLIYVLDDDLFHMPDNLVSTAYYKSSSVQARMKFIMGGCDALLSPSQVILDRYGNLVKRTALIEEPAMSSEGAKIRTAERDDVVRIGFAGSIDRGGDIDQILSETIRNLIRSYGDKIAIEFMGAKPKIVEELHLKYYPYADNYEEYQNILSELQWDIGLAPMPDSQFHQCKHYNKFIEYSAFGIVGVYSNVQPYVRIVEDGENGMLSDNTALSWTNKIAWLIEHPVERERIRQKAIQLANSRFTIEQVAQGYVNAVPEIIEYKSPVHKSIAVDWLRQKAKVLRGVDFVRRNGFASGQMLMKKINNRNHR